LPQVERRGVAVRTILGLLALLVLAYVGNHPRVRQLQETLRLGSAISVGFPFVALGLIARHPAVGVLDDRVLLALTPLVDFGLGWLGFLVGFRFDLALLDRLPRGSALVVALCTGMPFIAIILACGVTLMTFGFGMQDATTIRAVVVLGAAGAMTAPSAIRRAFPGAAEHTVGQHLDEIFGVIVLALLAAYMRPSGLQAQWALPGTAWVFMTLGIGATLSTVLYVSVRRPATPAEFMAIAVGSIAFAAGLAAYLRLSPLVICFVAGVAISNLPSAHREAFGRTLERFEQPIFLVFLALAGALWDPSDWRGWVLVPVFVASRAVGLRLGQFLAVKREPDAIERIRPRSLYLAPLSGVAIAVVINVRSLYGGPAVSFLITAVIGGAILAELVAAYSSRASNTGGAS
jgi:Kef-type K+ transport system membrane component KefB